MATTKEIKRRITSVKNTEKITKAMELVAASKMRKAVNMTLASREYAKYAWDMLQSVSAKSGAEVTTDVLAKIQPQKDADNAILAVLITSNRGLCGAYNSKAIKQMLSLVTNTSEFDAETKVRVVAIGKKGEHEVAKLGYEMVASFGELPDHVSLTDTNPIAELILDEYTAGRVKRVVVVYTDFVSPLVQTPHTRQFLPFQYDDFAEFIEQAGEGVSDTSEEKVSPEEPRDYLFEPDYQTLMQKMLAQLTRSQLYQMLLESTASEQSARMIAMKNASEAAGEMIDNLRLVFNKARQASITQEISEISAGMTSISS